MKRLATSALCAAVLWVQTGAADPLTKPYRLPDPGAQTSLNFFGLPGLIDLPGAHAMPDGRLALTVSSFGGQTRTTLAFQITPRLSASFRYVGIQDWNADGFETYRDRSFDARFLIAREGRLLPALTVGLQDFAGTGIYSGEYVVATKTFDRPFQLPGRVRLTGGLGWGRFGTSGDIGTPFSSDRPEFGDGSAGRGGSPSFDSWFRGPVSPFGGIEWQANDRWGLKAEYSPDAYVEETTRGVFERRSRLNFGVEYQYSERLRLGGYWLYGSEVGISAQLQLDPGRGVTPRSYSGPLPVVTRPDRASNPDVYRTSWTASQSVPRLIEQALTEPLAKDGIRLEALSVVSAQTVEVRIRNTRYPETALAIGRTARAMTGVLPPSVETFRITVESAEGLALTTVVLDRSDVETLEFAPNAAGQLLAASDVQDASSRLLPALTPEGVYPRFSWAIGPYFSPSFFDPSEPLRFDVGVSGKAQYRPARGWLVAGEVRGRLFGNIEDGRESNSQLPRVRTDAVLYARAADVTLHTLYAARYWKAAPNTYARVTAGYLEQMFGGVSSEVLWKRPDSRLALGAEVNYARQRDFDQALGFRDYDIVTGHVSAYYALDNGYSAQIDVGRYLAGDDGATMTLAREFANGWKLGGFFTLTDVTSEEFGEGSFDKGIFLSVPLTWLTGKPTQQTFSRTIRPVQRDGGARLSVPGRLNAIVQEGDRDRLISGWGSVWE